MKAEGGGRELERSHSCRIPSNLLGDVRGCLARVL
jgi:hypothetical protein